MVPFSMTSAARAIVASESVKLLLITAWCVLALKADWTRTMDLSKFQIARHANRQAVLDRWWSKYVMAKQSPAASACNQMYQTYYRTCASFWRQMRWCTILRAGRLPIRFVEALKAHIHAGTLASPSLKRMHELDARKMDDFKSGSQDAQISAMPLPASTHVLSFLCVDLVKDPLTIPDPINPNLLKTVMVHFWKEVKGHASFLELDPELLQLLLWKITLAQDLFDCRCKCSQRTLALCIHFRCLLPVTIPM